MFRSVLRRLFSRNPLHWVGAVMAFGAVAALGGFATAASGVANLSAIPPHPEGWARLLHYSSERAFAAHAGSVKEAPDEPLESRAVIMRGAAQFAIECSNCHGAPGFGQSPVALSMRPEPPGLEFAARTYSKEQLYYVVQNGVRYTSMPAWPVTNRPDEIWSLVAFLKAMPNMTREQYIELARGDAGTRARSTRSRPLPCSGTTTRLRPSSRTRPPNAPTFPAIPKIRSQPTRQPLFRGLVS